MLNIKKNWVGYLFVLSFILPLLLAYVVLKTGWYQAGVNNNGLLMRSEIFLEDWRESKHKSWTVLYVPSQNLKNNINLTDVVDLENSVSCNQFCENTKYAINQTYAALGKKQNKVDVLILNETVVGLNPTSLYLVDRFGLVVFEYPLQIEFENNFDTLKGLISDLKKLLKNARSEQKIS
ncbi:MAG: hypothetical protein HRU38_10660 [Saccharospirillaceae bacterium]|nr:hypothetical protein [Pseudomonadales bacterium]NRB79115.1 hypothetical protein [Saccharospirillaceae bacterium]